MKISLEEPKAWDPVKDFRTVLEILFEPDDIIRTVSRIEDFYQTEEDKKNGKWSPGRGMFKRKASSYLDSLKRNPGDIANTIGDWHQEAGGLIGLNPVDGVGVKGKNVTEGRYSLLESDSLPPEEQVEVYQELNLPVATLVHSGGKSIHAAVHIDAPDPKTYKARVDFLHEVLRRNGVDMDPATKDINRLTRLPGVTRNGRKQFLIATNIGAGSWDEWFEAVRDDYDDIADKVQTAHIETISAPELAAADLPPVEYIIEEKLQKTGSSMLVGPPKIGKSWAVLDLGLSVAAGRPFLGYNTNKVGVLYAALEDSLTRLQERMSKVLWEKDPPPGFDFTIEVPGIQNGLTSALDDYLKKKPNCGLIILDTLQKVRSGAKSGESVYGADYREMGNLKKFADAHGVNVMVVHHTRKMKDQDDIFNQISGTTGLMGASDTIWMLTKDKRQDSTANLNITGRDVLQQDLVLQFEKVSCRWSNLGDQDEYLEAQVRQEYENNPVVHAIKLLLDKSPEHTWTGNAKSLLEQGTALTQTRIAPSPKKLSSMLKELDQLLLENDGILHSVGSRGSGGPNHYFWYAREDSDKK